MIPLEIKVMFYAQKVLNKPTIAEKIQDHFSLFFLSQRSTPRTRTPRLLLAARNALCDVGVDTERPQRLPADDARMYVRVTCVWSQSSWSQSTRFIYRTKIYRDVVLCNFAA